MDITEKCNIYDEIKVMCCLQNRHNIRQLHVKKCQYVYEKFSCQKRSYLVF